jgi:hypothetical protein
VLKGTHIWLPDYLKNRLRRRRTVFPLKILFAFVDHFEPEQKPGDPPALQLERVRGWIDGYERRFGGHADRDGRPPLHTYFFPQEQYRSDVLDLLAGHCARGFGEVEVHIHHDNETESGFLEKMEEFKDRLAGHRLLSRDRSDGRIKYGFIHGNWALDNARTDGRWCGLNNEISLLRKTGCYCDFTLPCAPSDGQTRKVNSIYFCDDDPGRPKSHDRGRDVVFGGKGSGDLLMVQGPLALNWRDRSRGVLPRIENGDIGPNNPITRLRIRLWIDLGIGVAGRDDFVFVKVHTHGLKPRNHDFLLGETAERGFRILETEFNDGERYELYYVTAREMANIVMALNDGVDGGVEDLRDYRLVPLLRGDS